MYGKVMSVPDSAMPEYFRLVTRWTPQEISELENGMKSSALHPRDVKMRLAREIVSITYGSEAVELAEKAFIKVFQEHETPEDMPEFILKVGATLLETMTDAGLSGSKSEGRRLVKQRAVRLDGVVLDDPNVVLDLNEPKVLRVGKRRFLRLLPPHES
jgi:tyrosyl-tRNA synthetase